jgi:hypothetical protein
MFPFLRARSLPLAYWREWVKGDAAAQIPTGEKNTALSQYAKNRPVLPECG